MKIFDSRSPKSTSRSAKSGAAPFRKSRTRRKRSSTTRPRSRTSRTGRRASRRRPSALPEPSLGNIRAMHGKVAAGKAIAIDFNDAEKAIDIGTKIVDDNEWQKCLEGVYTGFSIGGDYIKKWKDAQSDAHAVHREAGRDLARRQPVCPTARVLRRQGATAERGAASSGTASSRPSSTRMTSRSASCSSWRRSTCRRRARRPDEDGRAAERHPRASSRSWSRRARRKSRRFRWRPAEEKPARRGARGRRARGRAPPPPRPPRRC
jgi:hypothetical protein